MAANAEGSNVVVGDWYFAKRPLGRFGSFRTSGEECVLIGRAQRNIELIER
jgi:hypothetical protein